MRRSRPPGGCTTFGGVVQAARQAALPIRVMLWMIKMLRLISPETDSLHGSAGHPGCSDRSFLSLILSLLGLFQIVDQGGYQGIGIIRFSFYHQCFDGDVSAVAALLQDFHEAGYVDLDRTAQFEDALLYLPVAGVRYAGGDIQVGIGYLVVAGVDDKPSPFGVYCLQDFDVLLGCLNHVAVVLDANDHAVLRSESGTLLVTVDHPACYFVPFVFVTFGDLACKKPDDRSSQFLCYNDPFLGSFHICRPYGRIGRGKIVANTGSADVYAQLKGFVLQVIEVLVGRNFRVTGEIVTGQVDGFDILGGAPIQQLRQC